MCTWNFKPKCPPSTSSSWGKDFENRLNTYGDIGFFRAQCTGWKWQNFKCCRCAKFSIAIAKLKYLRTWNFAPKCTPSTSSSWDKDFENRLNTFGDIGFFLAQCTGWKCQNFKCSHMQRFRLVISKVIHLRKSNLPPQCPTSTSSSWGNNFENRVKYFGDIGFLLAQCTGWKWQNLKCCRCAKFSIAIAKIKYLRTWNFQPKCPPSTSSSWGKDFENRLNTFGDIGYLLAHCTGWKWQNFKCSHM